MIETKKCWDDIQDFVKPKSLKIVLPNDVYAKLLEKSKQEKKEIHKFIVDILKNESVA